MAHREIVGERRFSDDNFVQQATHSPDIDFIRVCALTVSEKLGRAISARSSGISGLKD
jgi:hypothetical protein